MNIKRIQYFAVLLFISGLPFVGLLSTRMAKAICSANESLLIDPVYLPIVANNYSQSLFGITLYTLDEAGGLTQAVQAGAQWSRNGFIWKAIEPNLGDRNWGSQTAVEQGLLNANSRGMKTIMVIDGTPDWAREPGLICGPVTEGNLPALGNFVYDLVKRYSMPPYYVHYWELWNEPDVYGGLGCWGDVFDHEYYGGEYYGKMLQVVYPRMKEADPSAQVLIGGLLLDCDPNYPPEGRNCVEAKFLNGILQYGADNGLGANFDGVSFHAYDHFSSRGIYANPNWNSSSSTTGPASIAKAAYLRGVLAGYGYEDKYLLNTETAVFWGENILTPPCLVTDPLLLEDIEVTKIYYMVQTYAVAVAEGWKANLWFSAFGVRCSGLLNSDLSPKNSYFAFQYTQQELGGATYQKPISEYEGVMGFEYEVAGKKLWVIWSLDGLAHTIILPGTPLTVNRMGDDGHPSPEVPNGTTLTINPSDLAPRFIEFGN